MKSLWRRALDSDTRRLTLGWVVLAMVLGVGQLVAAGLFTAGTGAYQWVNLTMAVLWFALAALWFWRYRRVVRLDRENSASS